MSRALQPSNDALGPLVAAYRAENPGTALDARAVRERVLAVRRSRRQRPNRIGWLLPIAAVLAATTAVAASSPARRGISSLFASLGVGVAPPAAADTAPKVAAKSAPTAPAAPLAPVPNRAPALPRTASPSRIQSPEFASSPEHSAPKPAVTARLPSPAPTSAPLPSKAAFPSTTTAEDAAKNADLSAYHVAHRLHFASGDFARALSAWNNYLARFPNGTFAPEARLNRAVCLARLGRTSEARAALSAIDDGRYGENGRVQASRLLDELNGVP